MRKNAPRKWIHAILDLLPLLVIPIFAININQKEVEPITAQVEESKEVDFNQLLKARYDISDAGLDFTQNEDGSMHISGTTTIDEYIAYSDYNITFKSTDTYLFKSNYVSGVAYSLYGVSFDSDRTFTFNANTTVTLNIAINTTLDVDIKPMIINLTQMFGSGNEPTLTQFNQWYPNDYYSYTLSRKELLYTGDQLTLNNTDIGSQFLYSIYTPVKDYFNFNKLFNMQNIYDWMQLNLFEGMAPVPVFIIWNIIVYEFFVDLIFLLYSVFMFFIDFATNTLQRFLDRSR